MERDVITFQHYGDFTKTEKLFEHMKNMLKIGKLDKYGRMGVEYLSKTTPVDSGLTADSWYYRIEHDKDGATIYWNNSNVQNGVQIAMLIQYGHATRDGGFIEGIDYVNPSIREVFYKMNNDAKVELFGGIL